MLICIYVQGKLIKCVWGAGTRQRQTGRDCVFHLIISQLTDMIKLVCFDVELCTLLYQDFPFAPTSWWNLSGVPPSHRKHKVTFVKLCTLSVIVKLSSRPALDFNIWLNVVYYMLCCSHLNFRIILMHICTKDHSFHKQRVWKIQKYEHTSWFIYFEWASQQLTFCFRNMLVSEK